MRLVNLIVRLVNLIAIATALAACLPAADLAQPPTVSLDKNGSTQGKIPALRPGDQLYFDIPEATTLIYQFDHQAGDGKVLLGCAGAAQYVRGNPITIPADLSGRRTMTEGKFFESRPVRALYFNLTGTFPATKEDKDKRTELVSQLNYYSKHDGPLSWDQKKVKQDQIEEKKDQIAQLQDEIKAFTGTSLGIAVEKIEALQKKIQFLHGEIRNLQKEIENSGNHDQLEALTKQFYELSSKINTPTLLRAGVLIIGEDRKPVYYTLNQSGDASQPWRLKLFQEFPIFTTNDAPYIVVLGQRYTQDPQGLRASFTSKAGAYIDSDPVRPVVTQLLTPSASAKSLEIKRVPEGCLTPEPPTYTYVDRVLQFTDHLAGETTYMVTVSGYGLATTKDSLTVIAGTTPSTQQQKVTEKITLKPLDAEALPQVHSLYRYNISTGVVWSTIRTPTFSRVATGNYFPAGCGLTTSVATTGATTSSVTGTTMTTGTTTTTTTGTTTTNSPSTVTTTTCAPTYQTLQVSGGPRILPVLMFTFYPTKRDTQVKTVSWKEVIPAPAIGLSLSSPSDDFFLGASSELKPFRNLQLVYGVHLGRIEKLGANGFQIPTDGTAPQTTTSLHTGAFVGLTFNIDFIKSIFK
ncbi:MAG TPA: hypothetical protein VHU83_07855 [Bryobacteraceae bacterium]|nr:hypothetical protein [Bryobacteraceae bacterium]